MSTILDVFKADGFSTSDLTAAINLMPYVPNRLGAKKLFEEKGVETLTVDIERKAGKISVLPFSARGSGQGTKRAAEKRELRTIKIPHVLHYDSLLADSIQNVRKFGSPDRLEAISEKTNDVLAGLRQNHEITHEYHRAGALSGLVNDADGSEVIDIYDTFGLTPKEVDFELDDSSTSVKAKCDEVHRLIEDGLGAATYSGIECQCGDDFFDAIVNHASVTEAWKRWNDGEYLRSAVQRDGMTRVFEHCGIRFENYRWRVGSTSVIPTAEARFYPIGLPGLFIGRFAPADYIEAVNTIGLPVYVKQEEMKFGKGIEFESQSNPLFICTQLEAVVQGTTDIGT